MKTSQETIAYLALRIGYLYYYRPLAYGGSADGVEVLLFTYHEVWSEIVGRYDEFRNTYWQVLAEQGCGAANFPHYYVMNHPGASQEEITAYVVQHWRTISDRLGVPIQHAELAAEFASHREAAPDENSADAS